MSTPLRQLQERSASPRELVLSYRDAETALDTLEGVGASILGWEGWLRYPDKRLGHSGRHQGTTGLGQLPRAEAYSLCRSTIRAAHTEFLSKPEVEGGELLYCLTHDS
jgi:hypothetical protein